MRPVCQLMIFSTLYTTLTHNLIKEKLINLVEWTFKGKVHLILPVTKHRLSSLLETQNDINFGLVKTCVKPKYIFWIIFILDLALSYTVKLLIFRWVLIVLLL